MFLLNFYWKNAIYAATIYAVCWKVLFCFGVVCCGKMDPQNGSAPFFSTCFVKYAAEQNGALHLPDTLLTITLLCCFELVTMKRVKQSDVGLTWVVSLFFCLTGAAGSHGVVTAWKSLRSVEQSSVGIKITPWHLCQIFFTRLSRTFQVQLKPFFLMLIQILCEKSIYNKLYNLTAYSKPS